MEYFILLIVFLCYIGLVVGSFPVIRLNRASIVFLVSSIIILTGFINLDDAIKSIDFKIIIFLFGVMVVNSLIYFSGFFHWVSFKMFSNRKIFLLIKIVFISAILSALFLNDTIAFVFTPVIIKICRDLKIDPKPYLISFMMSINIGSMATITGNPQNIIVATKGNISYLEFLSALFLPTIISLFFLIVLVILFYPDLLSNQILQEEKKLDLFNEKNNRIIHKPLFIKSFFIILLVLILLILGIEPALVMLIASSLVFFTRRIKSSKILSMVDFELLIIFSGLFVITEAIKDIISPFIELLYSKLGLLISTFILSQFISNVPAVLILLTKIKNHYDLFILSSSSTLAGNFTLLSSIANLIVLNFCQKFNIRIGFWEHFKIGSLITVISLIVIYLFLP